jgi:hypothetical protein
MLRRAFLPVALVLVVGCGSDDTREVPAKPVTTSAIGASGASEVPTGQQAPAAVSAQQQPQGAATPQYIPPPRSAASSELTAKSDLRHAVSILEAYFAAKQTYTSNLIELGPYFPTTVTVVRATSLEFTAQATTAAGSIFSAAREGDRHYRTCVPVDPRICPDGTWP